MRICVTGGCGFIGSHQCVALLNAGHEVVIIDDLSNSSYNVVDRIKQLGGPRLRFFLGDVRDEAAMFRALEGCDAIVAFAARKHVNESIGIPVDYYSVNVQGLLTTLRAAERRGIHTLVFSSTGSIYGETTAESLTESSPLQPTNPYSASKMMAERILADLAHADDRWQLTALRYFNPAGAHASGKLGEAPTAAHRNLVPILTDAALSGAAVKIFGNDFNTPDGTAIRDYIHINDVTAAHLRALECSRTGFNVFNIGTGTGVSVQQLCDAMRAATGRMIATEVVGRREGDVSRLVADVSKARDQLGFVCQHDAADICTDAWRWATSALVAP